MNMLQRIRKKRHVAVFAASVSVFAGIVALGFDLVLLDPVTASETRLSGFFTAISVGSFISYFVGLKVMEVNMLTAKLDHLASYDFLTGAMTRAKFFGHLNAIRDRSGALLVLDMDNFKQINDTLGHATGDKALFMVAQTTRKNFGAHDCLCRMGGDEFCVFFPGVDLQEAQTLARWIQQAIANQSVGSDDTTFALSASFGIAMLQSGGDPDAAIAVADAELYHAKAKRPSSYARPKPDHRQVRTARR